MRKRKIPDTFFDALPRTPGIYVVRDERGAVIYVGKAKNLKRRLSQYRNAKRIKAHRKMRSILGEAVSIEPKECESELAALLEETRLIQSLKPKWNVSGAFSFLYPMVGVKWGEEEVAFIFTNESRELEGFEPHGAYRSRFIVAEAFFSWMRLLSYVAHRVAGKARVSKAVRGYTFRFRRFPPEWAPSISKFLRGESPEALELLLLALLENAGARRDASDIQDDINALKRFYRHEAQTLRRAIKQTGHPDYPVKQEERDPLMLRWRYKDACAP